MTLPVSKPTVWVHVATLMNWGRPPVGIVRVEQEYCRWLLAGAEAGGHDHPVRFCAYDRPAGQFVEVAKEQVAARLGRAQTVGGGAGPQAATGLKLRIKRALLTAASYLPASWTPRLKAAARQGYHELLVRRARMRLTVSRWLGAVRAPAPASFQAAPLAAGDRFVSLGLDWEYLDQQALYRLKQRLELKTTLICYDVIPALFPHLVVLPPGGFGAYLVDMAWCADAVLCISEHTQRDCEAVLGQLGAPVPPTHVIRLGSDIRGAGAQEGHAPQGMGAAADERPFVLFVSTIERRKNHEMLYRAWTRLRDSGMVPHRLVFVGMPGWGVTDLMNDLRLDPRIQDDIVCLNHVSDVELAWLYRHAAFTVFPSLYEGWGLPVVESLAWGKFCLASNAASLPEAGGTWAEYLDPWDLPAWVERLGHYMRHPEEVEARNARIAREFQAPTWAQTAAQIHRIALAAEPRKSP